jgi:hypothetical protein
MGSIFRQRARRRVCAAIPTRMPERVGASGSRRGRAAATPRLCPPHWHSTVSLLVRCGWRCRARPQRTRTAQPSASTGDALSTERRGSPPRGPFPPALPPPRTFKCVDVNPLDSSALSMSSCVPQPPERAGAFSVAIFWLGSAVAGAVLGRLKLDAKREASPGTVRVGTNGKFFELWAAKWESSSQ